MKILMTGGTGLVGQELQKVLTALGHQLIILTRKSASKKSDDIEWVQWDGQSEISGDYLKDIDLAINLAGESIAKKRWTRAQKQQILNSRVLTTQKLVNAINHHALKCQALISASAIGRYPLNQKKKMTEEDQQEADHFLAEVCQQWEEEATKVRPSCRLCIIRIGMVLAANGGALTPLTRLFKLGLGGKIGNGQQVISWVHLNDLTNAIVHLINHPQLSGIYNVTAPQTVSNKEFTRKLAKSLKRPWVAHAPSFALKLILGEMATLAIDSQDVSSQKLIESGLHFEFSNIDQAFKQLFNKE